jgi:hypothetical protein
MLMLHSRRVLTPLVSLGVSASLVRFIQFNLNMGKLPWQHPHEFSPFSPFAQSPATTLQVVIPSSKLLFAWTSCHRRSKQRNVPHRITTGHDSLITLRTSPFPYRKGATSLSSFSDSSCCSFSISQLLAPTWFCAFFWFNMADHLQ